MANITVPTDVTMANASAFFGKLATTNYYQVFIGGFKTPFYTAMNSWGPKIDLKKYGESIGLLCTDATIPASTYATAEVKDNYMGVPQEFAHTRLYTDIDFTFYIDRDYTILSFFEFWMNYIGGGSQAAASTKEAPNVFRRMNYPSFYKTSEFLIVKFEKDYKRAGSQRLKYRLINAFPKAVTSIPISYGPTDLLKITITMNYDRYIVGRETTPVPDISQKPNIRPEPTSPTGYIDITTGQPVIIT